MTANDVLRRLRFALNLPDAELGRLLATVGQPVAPEVIAGYFAREDNEAYVECPDVVLGALLDALVLDRRGPRDPNAPPVVAEALDNNVILRKLRIALSYKEPEMIATLAAGGMRASPSELSALFRQRNHKHYRAAGDQLMRAFFEGLTARLRGIGGKPLPDEAKR
jgi:uncharacterized protein YehS (DUF1456 family)